MFFVVLFQRVNMFFLIIIFLFTNLDFSIPNKFQSKQIKLNLSYEELEQIDSEELGFQREDVFFNELKISELVKLIPVSFLNYKIFEIQFEKIKFYFSRPPPNFA